MIYYRLATILFACVQTLHKEALPPSRSVHHFASKGATFKKSAESHVSINMAVVLRTKIYLICRRPDGLTAVHGSINGTRLFKIYISPRAGPHKAREAPTTTTPFFLRALFADRSARQQQTQIYTKYMEGLRAVRLVACQSVGRNVHQGGLNVPILPTHQFGPQSLDPVARAPHDPRLSR